MPPKAGPAAKKKRRKKRANTLLIPSPPRGAKQRALLAVERLRNLYPAATELTHANAFELLIATILSAQTTDRSVNQVTPKLFARYPTALDLAGADPAELEQMLIPTGFFRTKTRRIIAASRALVEIFGGEVPKTMDELVQIPGIGRKTANVILGAGFEEPGFAVDTHVKRLSNLLGLVRTRDPVKIEAQVDRMIPAVEWTGFSLRLILHGRRICIARRPRCEECVMNDFCPSSCTRPEGLRRQKALIKAGLR